MKSGRSVSMFFLIVIIGTASFTDSYCQANLNTTVEGLVKDLKTREVLPYVSVLLDNTTVGTLTDINGRYKIVTSKTSYRISFSFMGYETESRIITPGITQIINVELINSSIELGEVLVKPNKQVYRNKNNPAVDLIVKVIQHKGLNRKESLDFFTYEKYEKLVFALSNIGEKFKHLSTFRKFDFIFNNVDTSLIDGKQNLPVFIKETVSTYNFRKNPRSDKEVIKAEKNINLSEYIDIKGFTANLNYLYQNINIYDNEIFFLTNKFLSPVASTASLLYRYYIIDTSMVNSVRCIKMFFEPRNPADFLFHGFLYITDDSRFAVKKIDMSFNKGINIDWIKDVRVIQDFEEIGHDAWLLTNDEIFIDFGLTPNLPGMLGHRIVSYKDYSVNEPIADAIFIGPDLHRSKDATEKSEMYWESVRIPPLTYPEKNLYTIVDSLKRVPALRHQMNLLMLLTTNYLIFGKFEIGPDETFYSYNPVEGNRVRFGGRTTPEFNKSIYFESYLAYGFTDKRLKYDLTASYSLTKTSIYEFPVKSFRLSYQYDTKIPGQELMYTTGDNIFTSIKRGVNDKLFYNKTIRLDFLHEFENHFSYNIGYRFTKQESGGNLHFIPYEDIPLANEVHFINISEISLKLRFAPKEEFYQGKLNRAPVPSKYPVLWIHYIVGSKALTNDYNYQKILLGISRRFYISIIGYTDISAEAGKIIGKVPYPLLFIHNANQSYAYQRNAYNMMNFLEFVSDQYISLNLDHSFNGFFFNKIPLLKKLKLREVATLRALYGGLSGINNPELNPGLFKFPSDSNGVPLTYSLDKKPYIEASIGVSNIFRFLRVDLIKRFTYLDNPNVATLGVRAQIKFDF
jgi:hypothetical protein